MLAVIIGWILNDLSQILPRTGKSSRRIFVTMPARSIGIVNASVVYDEGIAELGNR